MRASQEEYYDIGGTDTVYDILQINQYRFIKTTLMSKKFIQLEIKTFSAIKVCDTR